MKLLILILSFQFFVSAKAQQNLIPDSSFELYNHLPESIYINKINEMLPYWFQPTNGTPDYFHKNTLYPNFGVPYNNVWGSSLWNKYRKLGLNCFNNQTPKTGNAYAGFGIRDRFDTFIGKQTQEYLQTKFIYKMKKNYFYKINFFINKDFCTNDFSVSNIGAYISKDSIRNFYAINPIGNQHPNITNFIEKYDIQISNKNLLLLEDTVNWVSINGNYKALGEESWITIGRFNEMPKTQKIYDTTFFDIMKFVEAYYFIDDVSVYEIPSVIYPDTVCYNEQVTFTSTLKAPFKWQYKGKIISTDSIYTFTAKQSGQYILQSYNRLDTFNLIVKQNTKFELGNDTFICLGNTLKLNIPITNAIITWHNGTKDSVFNVTKGGTYFAKSEKEGCTYADTITIESRYKPVLEYTENEICLKDSAFVEINLYNNAYKYYWHKSNDSVTIKNLHKKECYPFTIIGINQCNLDTEICINNFCNPTLWVPNAFVPNGKNNIFECKGINIKNFNITIYNRWGEKLFYSNNINNGWNGEYKNQDCEMGIYIYLISYNGLGYNSEIKIESGTIDLIR